MPFGAFGGITIFIFLAILGGLVGIAWLIWRSARRIHAAITGRWPVRWRTIRYLGALRFPILFLAAVASAALEFSRAEFSLSDALLASIVVLLALIRKR